MAYRNERGHHQNSKSNNLQKVIQDQNYSNQIFYTVLSTLQSLCLFYRGNHGSQFNNKMFKGYDKVDYRSKNIKELKSQLQTHIFLFQASRQAFTIEHPNESWQLPANFNKEASKRFVREAINILSQAKDQQSINMAKDIFLILDGSLNGLYSQQIKLAVNYSEAQKKSFNNNLFKNGSLASQQMDKRSKQVQNVKNVNQLNARINYNGNFFTENQMANNYTQYPTHHDKNNTTKMEEQQKMDVQQSKYSFLALNQQGYQFFKQLQPRKYYLQYFNKFTPYYFQNKKQLNDASAKLLKEKYRYILFVIVVDKVVHSWEKVEILNDPTVNQIPAAQTTIYILSEKGTKTNSFIKQGSLFPEEQLKRQNKSVKIFYSQIDLQNELQYLYDHTNSTPKAIKVILLNNGVVKKSTILDVYSGYNQNKRKDTFQFRQ